MSAGTATPRTVCVGFREWAVVTEWGGPVQDATFQQTRFGERFQVRAQSGAGGMATIYRATDALTGEDVALKLLHAATASPERFNQEAALLAELAHPAIVRYVDHGITATGERYLAMEWLEGETLEQRLTRGALGILDSLRLGRRVLEGLGVAHRKGIVHRDIKPANLFLPDGDLARVKLLDFGIARRTADTRRITLTGSALGTPAYMSPEQVRGARALDARSDVFSLGSVLYECITGETAFPGETPLAVLARICLEDAVSVETRHPELPPAVSSLLTRMLAKDPDTRPASAAELAAQIGTLIDALIVEGHVTGERLEPRARTVTPHLATAEQRVVSAILVSRPRSDAASVAPGTWDVPGTTRHAFTEVFDEPTFGKIRDAVAPFGARVDVFLGTALAVTLVGEGTPTDHAAQAARCALALKAVLPRVCFAVSTGRTVMGEDSLGDLVAGTARLLGSDAGAIRLDDVTAGLLESRFQVRHDHPGGHHLLFEKGLKEAPRTVLGKELPCVGRDREIGTLIGLWDEATGEPVARAVLVTAPAGAGKSRVRHELLERLQSRDQPFQYLIGRGDSVRAGAPFAVLGPALRAAAGLAGGEPADIQQRRLLAHVERRIPGPNGRRVAAFLGEIADVSFPDADLPQLRAARQDPRLMADQTLGAWLDFIEAECAAQPVLLVLEDLHWGDVPSVQLVDAALRTLRERPLMVLALARPEVDDKFPGLWTERDLQRIALAPLTAKSAGKLVQHVLAALPPDKAAWIVERADGNPFYLEELIRAVGEGADPASGAALPDTVIGMVQARFDALGPEAKRILRAAAIFGHTFKASGVRALVGDEDRSVGRWLDILAKKEIVFPRQAADTREFVFRHALVEEAAYAMLVGEDRVLGHRLAGEWLEAEGEREAIVLVEHFERGGVKEKAAAWCRVATEQALEANDLGAVIERGERGVRLGAEGEGLGTMRVLQAQARFWRGEYREAETAAQQALQFLTGPRRLTAASELIAALGQQAKFAEVESWADSVREDEPGPGGSGAWLDCLLRATAYLGPGGLREASARMLESISRHASSLEPSGLARLQSIRASAAASCGNHGEALTGWDAATQAFAALGDSRSAMEMLANQGGVMAEVGLLEQAEEKLVEVIGTAERMDLGFVIAFSSTNLTMIRAYLGRFAEAREAGERALSLSRQQGDRRVEGATEFALSVAAFMESKLETAEQHARTAVRLLANIKPLFPAALASLARALLRRGKAGEALEYARDGYRLLVELGGVEDGEALIRLVYAECLLSVGEREAASGIAAEGAERLEQRASRIADCAWRTAFLARIPVHSQTLQLAASLPSSTRPRT
jgi:tetratricopeptide (TPR) repeat protein